MALNLSPSKSQVGHPGLRVSGEWIQEVKGNPSLSLEYRHTQRVTPVIVDCSGSTRATALLLANCNLLDETQEDGQPVFTFAGQEGFWNNKWRARAIEEGLHEFVPQVLYLVRPETAYISCLHFLAKELGGMENHADQRNFIFRNPGLQSLMGPFWARFQETYWSGGFSPALGENDRLLLILSLIECLKMTVGPEGGGGSRVPCPHLPLEDLHDAGVILPSLQFPELIPSSAAIDELREAQKRNNLPGLPSPLGSYIECYACVKSFSSPDEKATHECIPLDELKCTGCGLIFKSHQDYNVHALSFCHEGPLTQSKCAVCGSNGPNCVCATHWKRTFALVNSVMEGAVIQAEWLSDCDNLVSLLIAANVYLEVDLVVEPQPGETIAAAPRELKESLWNPERVRFPQATKDREMKVVLPDHDQPLAKSDLLSQLQDVEIEYTLLSPNAVQKKQIQRTPKATHESMQRGVCDKYIGTGGITVENAGYEELRFLETKIKLTECKLAIPHNAALLARAMGREIHNIQQGLEGLKHLASAIALKITLAEERSDPEQENRRERLKFLSPLAQSRGGSQRGSPTPSMSPSNSQRRSPSPRRFPPPPPPPSPPLPPPPPPVLRVADYDPPAWSTYTGPYEI